MRALQHRHIISTIDDEELHSDIGWLRTHSLPPLRMRDTYVCSSCNVRSRSAIRAGRVSLTSRSVSPTSRRSWFKRCIGSYRMRPDTVTHSSPSQEKHHQHDLTLALSRLCSSDNLRDRACNRASLCCSCTLCSSRLCAIITHIVSAGEVTKRQQEASCTDGSTIHTRTSLQAWIPLPARA